MLLKQLTSINGVAGNEQKVREFIIEQITPYVDDVITDSMGSVIAYKKGTAHSGKTVMICAHMDEVGFIVSDITENGFVKFKQVGGFDERILLTQRVVIQNEKNCVSGVMGIKAVHLQTKAERSNVVSVDSMYIDIGAKDKADALKYVSKGDFIAFDSDYTEFGDGFVKAKAIDDRVGCAIMLELVKGTYNNDLYFCFSTQEEVGLRGSRVIAHRLNSDIAIVLEATTAADIPFTDDYLHCSTLGCGPVISIMDRASYSNKKLNKFVCSVADNNNIKYQFKRTINGGNDAGGIQATSSPVRVCAISLPCRYIHSPVCTAKLCDVDAMYKLVFNVVKDIDKFEI